MQINVKVPQYDDSFLLLVSTASRKGCTAQFSKKDTKLSCVVFANGRVVGKFQFILDQLNYILDQRHIIERDFYPLEFAVHTLAEYVRSSNVLAICWL